MGIYHFGKKENKTPSASQGQRTKESALIA